MKRQLRSLRIVLIGVLVGVIPVLVFDDRPTAPLIAVTGALGAVVAIAVRRYVRL